MGDFCPCAKLVSATFYLSEGYFAGMSQSQLEQRKQRYVDLQHWVLGAALASPEALAQPMLNTVEESAFIEPSLVPVHRAIKAIMDGGGKPPTAQDVALWLQTNDSAGYRRAGEVDRIEYLSQVGEDAIATFNNVFLLNEALNKAAGHLALQELTDRYFREAPELADDQIEAFTVRMMRDLEVTRAKYSGSDIDEFTFTAADSIEAIDRELAEIRNGGKPQGIPLRNFPKLSKYLGGLQPGNLTIVAARPAIGKTTFCCNLFAPLCEAGLSVLMFSIEMKHTEIMKNVLSCRFGIPRSSFGDEEGMSPEQQATYDLHKGRVSHWKFTTVEKPGINIAELRQQAKKLAESDEGLDVIVVDYVQIVESDKEHSGGMQEKIGHVTYQLKFLAMELGVPVIATCQLNRNSNGEEERTPTASGIRGSDVIFQAANHLVALHRPRDNTAEYTEAHILKNRSGPTDLMINLDTALSICMFAEDMGETLAENRREDSQFQNPDAYYAEQSFSMNAQAGAPHAYDTY